MSAKRLMTKVLGGQKFSLSAFLRRQSTDFSLRTRAPASHSPCEAMHVEIQVVGDGRLNHRGALWPAVCKRRFLPEMTKWFGRHMTNTWQMTLRSQELHSPFWTWLFCPAAQTEGRRATTCWDQAVKPKFSVKSGCWDSSCSWFASQYWWGSRLGENNLLDDMTGMNPELRERITSAAVALCESARVLIASITWTALVWLNGF